MKELHDEAWLRNQYEVERKTTREIGEMLGCGFSSVCRALKRFSIKPHPRWEECPPSSTKKCCHCKQDKPLHEFGTAKRERDGLRHRCRDCFNEYTRMYNAANSEKRKEISRRTNKRLGPGYFRERHQALKRAVIDAYGGKCECCGEDEIVFLSLDHRNGGGGKHRKKIGSRTYRILRDAGWPRSMDGYEFRLLCMNCQFGYMHGRTCPHQLKKEQSP